MSDKQVTIIGAGLAGSEAAYQITKKGIKVSIFEMRPDKTTKAHKTNKCAELVCSNSFRGADLTNAVGLLKEELRLWDSLIMKAADHSKTPAGGAMAVDREKFSDYVDSFIRSNPLINFQTSEITEIPEPNPNNPVIIATGPLTSPGLSNMIKKLTGENQLSFFDAISPIIHSSSIDFDLVFRQSRYDKGEGADYLNIPLNKEEYYKFIDDVLTSEKFGGHEEVESDDIQGIRPFEGCMPIEDMAMRGIETLRYGPLKPVGLTDPRTGTRPYAVIQLRQDNLEGTLWSMVGFQTRMKHPEQLRIFKTLKGLENAEFVRLGSVHRNTFIDSPKCLNPTLEFRSKPGLFFAGQITGTEGYVESTSGGLVAGMNALKFLNQEEQITHSIETAIGALMYYISDPSREYFQPMNISYGLMPSYANALAGVKKKDKKEVRISIAKRALEITSNTYSLL
jgi:methylenetetrahydrofolate--tRNA-(uracil-5-)-methyltransferase